MSKIYIPQRFSNEVIAHIAGIFSEESKKFPLILAIYGNPGDGKTFMCEELLKDYNIQISQFSVCEFENASSGVPAQKLRERYTDIVNKYEKTLTYGTLIINDFDTAGGIWGDMYQYTVNTQHILGELMQIADPYLNEKRIPIIITGNNFSTIYTPLKRSGRIYPFYWQPTNDELYEILMQVYPELTKSDIDHFTASLTEYSNCKGGENLSVAFYTSLRSKFIKEKIVKQLDKRKGLKNIISSISYDKMEPITANNIIELGKSEIDNIVSMNTAHFGRSGG